jgi:hypothetical protein
MIFSFLAHIPTDAYVVSWVMLLRTDPNSYAPAIRRRGAVAAPHAGAFARRTTPGRALIWRRCGQTSTPSTSCTEYHPRPQPAALNITPPAAGRGRAAPVGACSRLQSVVISSPSGCIRAPDPSAKPAPYISWIARGRTRCAALLAGAAASSCRTQTAPAHAVVGRAGPRPPRWLATSDGPTCFLTSGKLNAAPTGRLELP